MSREFFGFLDDMSEEERREFFATRLREMDYHNIEFKDDGTVSVDFWPPPTKGGGGEGER